MRSAIRGIASPALVSDMDPEKPGIAVVVANWNRRDLLAACLHSLAAQTLRPAEIAVVDNGSDDGSLDMLEGLAASPEFARIPLRIIKNHENRGFCAANNQGIQATTAEFVALLNNDAEAEPGWLAALSKVFDGQPAVGMAASKILVWEDPTIIDKVGHVMYPDGQNRGRGHGVKDIGQYNRIEEVLWPDGCAAMYRRAMLDEIGHFDEDLFAYADDADLGLRARWAGWSCLYSPHAVVRHHRGSTLGLQSAWRVELIERNRVLLVVKLFPWSLIWRNAAYLIARIAAGMVASMRNRGEMSRFPGIAGKARIAWALIKADCSAMVRIPATLRKRRQFRPRRLSPLQIHRILMRHRISLKEISEQMAS
ncbi:MAG: glycosyltransferase family 2 protein [Bryobacteraceae bacterium]